MLYAIRQYGSGREKLVELGQTNDLEFNDRIVDAHVAHQWVRSGRTHETGLWIDDYGIIQYAEAEA